MEKLSDTKGSGCGNPPCPMLHPWLVFPYGKNRKFQVFVDPLDPSNRSYRKKLPEMRYHSYLQPPSGEGWLIMSAYEEKDSRSSKYSDCFLWNPETSEKIQLPSHFHWMNKYVCYGHVIYSPPGNDNIYDSIVCVLFLNGEDEQTLSPYFILYCHPGDKQWRKQNLPTSFERHDVSRLVCLKGKLYIVSSIGDNLFEVEIESHNYDGTKTVLKITPFFKKEAMKWLGMISSPYRCSETNIVESRDEVFKVTRHYYHPYEHVKQIFELEVFRMDFSSMAWKELRSLGDHVLFLDVEGKTSVACSAKELGLTKGCIFFIQDSDKTLYKFDIEDGSIEFSLPCPNLPTPLLSPSWMTIGRAREGRAMEEDIIIKAEEERKANIKNDDGKDIITKSSGIELEEESRHTSWDSLNQNILELISFYLPLPDYFHFRVVCRENRLATTTKMKHMQCESLSPWLIFLKAKDGVHNLAEPIYNDKFFISTSDTLIDATIRYSKGGWLLMTKTNSRTIFFYNPFTRAMIHLPDIPDDFPVHNISSMSFSSLPTSSDCVVMGIAVDWGFKEIWALSVARGDDFWNYGDVENTIYLPSEELNVDFVPWRNNPVFYKEAFYCLDLNGKLGVSDARTGEWEILDLHGPCDSPKQSFLVECEGKLLAVFLSHSRTCVKVFRLDIDKKLWITVESLGKYMLFISNTSSLSAVAPNSRMENKIYFPRFHGEDIVYYSLDTCKYHTFGSQEYSGLDFSNTKEQLYCSWIEPNWSSTPAEELSWCSPVVTEQVDE